VFPTSHRPLRAFAAASVLLLVGCIDATSPPVQDRLSAAAVAPDAALQTESLVALARAVPLRAPAAATVVITSDGGELALPAAGLRVVFPAGAVSAPVAITVRTASSGRVAYDFAPHGMRFAAPVRVEQSVAREAAAGRLPPDLVASYVAAGFTDSRDGVHTADEVSAVEVSADAGIAAFAVSHFSGYQLASGRKKR